MIYPALKISDYVIEDELGRGGFGSVYLAVDNISGQKVAIKFLHPKVLRSAGARQGFMDEMINQAKLSMNPNIVHIVRSISYKDKQGEYLGMVMEYVDGDPLDLYIQKHGLLPDFVAVPIFLQVLNGLSFAHQNNMLHRDIKPGNIIIGKNGIVKIMDFGLSKMVQGSSAASESARAASLSYVAPERLEKKQIDAKTDIYSLGAAFYEALTGQPPYQLDFGDWDEAKRKHKSGNFKRIQDFYPLHSEELEGVIRRCLAPEPSARFDNCQSISTELQNVWKKIARPPDIKPEFKKIIEKTKGIEIPLITGIKPETTAPDIGEPVLIGLPQKEEVKKHELVSPVISEEKHREMVRSPGSDKTPASRISKPPKNKQYLIIAGLAAAIIVVIIGIASYFNSKAEEDAWRMAKNIHSINSYEAYVDKYPDGKYSNRARVQVYNLEERNRKETQRKQNEERKRKEQLEKDREYNSYFSSAKHHFNVGDYDDALRYVSLAENIKNTDELKKLQNQIIAKKAENGVKVSDDRTSGEDFKFDNIGDVDPRRAAQYNRQGIKYIKKKEYRNALFEFTKAVKANKNNAEYWNNLGYTYSLMDKFRVSNYYIQKALDLSPDRAVAYGNMGYNYAKMGQEERAVNLYLKYVSLLKTSRKKRNGMNYLKKEARENEDQRIRQVLRQVLQRLGVYYQ